MKSETETKSDKRITNKLSILIGLWVMDKIIMTILILWI